MIGSQEAIVSNLLFPGKYSGPRPNSFIYPSLQYRQTTMSAAMPHGDIYVLYSKLRYHKL